EELRHCTVLVLARPVRIAVAELRDLVALLRQIVAVRVPTHRSPGVRRVARPPAGHRTHRAEPAIGARHELRCAISGFRLCPVAGPRGSLRCHGTINWFRGGRLPWRWLLSWRWLLCWRFGVVLRRWWLW